MEGSTTLEKLLGFLKNPEAIKAANELFAKVHKEKVNTTRTKAIRYRIVHIHTTCEHCGFMSHRLVNLGKKDSISYKAKNGEVHIVKFSDINTMMDVQAVTRCCNNCANFINNMDVEELKIRYWNLLNHSPADMKHPPIKPPAKKTADIISLDEVDEIEDTIIQENEEVAFAEEDDTIIEEEEVYAS